VCVCVCTYSGVPLPAINLSPRCNSWTCVCESVCVRECLQSVCVRMYIFGSPSHQSKSSLSHMCVREGERDSEGKRVCVRERVHLYIFENPCPRH